MIMTTATYQQLALDWHPQSKTDKPFVIFASLILTLFMGLAIFMGSIEVPKETRREKIVIPERIAKFILDKPKVIKKEPVKPKVVKKELPKPKIIEPEKPKEQVKPQVKKQHLKKEVVLTKKQASARKNASESGLLALSQELSDLMDTENIDSMLATKIAKTDNNTNNGKAAFNNTTDLLTANASKGSGGVSAGKLLHNSNATIKLDKAQMFAAQQQLLASRADTQIVKVTNADKSKAGSENAKRTGNYRPEEDIAYVMDKNKSKLHALYRKARRTNPNIKGKIVLEITISAAGKVLKVAITSSDLNDNKLESRIVARVKQFDFGADNVKAVTVTYPIEFLPS